MDGGNQITGAKNAYGSPVV